MVIPRFMMPSFENRHAAASNGAGRGQIGAGKSTLVRRADHGVGARPAQRAAHAVGKDNVKEALREKACGLCPPSSEDVDWPFLGSVQDVVDDGTLWA